MSQPFDHPLLPDSHVGVLLINLGTPDGYSYRPMRRYLKEFLSDQRVIEANPIKWKIILNCFILTLRPQISGKKYESIWNHEKNESPLRTTTRSQCELIRDTLAKKSNGKIITDWAMRYGTPSIDSRLQKMVNSGARHIMLFALYPQYCAATSATAYDSAFTSLKKMRWQPAVRTMPPYHDDALYIKALAQSYRKFCQSLSWQPEVTLASFHGLPQSYFDKGDPYHCHCAKTTRLLREELKMNEDQLKMTFQSRFGKSEWLKPYNDETIKQLARDGVKNIVMITPGFVSDCVETLEEIAIEGRDIFSKAGGQNYGVVPCLNDHPSHIECLTHLIEKEIQGWI